MKRSHSPNDKRVLNNLYEQLKNEINVINDDSFKNYLRELIADENTDYSLWKPTKCLNRPKNRIHKNVGN